MTITAKYRGRCITCEGVILPGERIEWTRGSRIVQHTSCRSAVVAANSDTDDGPVDEANDESKGWGVYYGSSRVSNVATFSSGATIYTNKRGRCEDAPCCGCCS